jgi:hypothetical protein
MYYHYKDYSKFQENKTSKDTGMTPYGTWGLSAAGLLIITKDNQEIMLLLRSKVCTDPLLWGTPGGALMMTKNGLEQPIVRAITEGREELGSLPKGKIRAKPYIFELPNSDFKYYTFILEVSNEEKENFVPMLNWEHDEWKWFKVNEVEDLPDLHPGVKDLLIHYDL